MTLDVELLQVLTSGDNARMEAMLNREEHGGADNGQVAINVHAAEPGCFILGVASNGNTALHLVASRGHVELARLLCERAPSLAATRNRFLDTPLHCAAKAGHRDVAAVLLSTMQDGGADEESARRARNQTGATALYEAVRHGHHGVVDHCTATVSRRCTWRRLPSRHIWSALCYARRRTERRRRRRSLVRRDGPLFMSLRLLAKKLFKQYWTGSQKVQLC